MAELVDAHGSGPCAFGCGGSSPLLGTINIIKNGFHPAIQPFGINFYT